MVAPNGKPNNIIKDLIVLHNINEYQIKEANKLGGLVTPSIAIIKAGNSFTDFGSITLVGTKELINPKNRNVKVFAGDVYSPSVPRKLYYVDKRLLENITNQLIKKAYQYDDTISKSDREIYHLVYYAIGSHTSFEEDINKRSINELVDYYYDKLKIVYIIDKLIKIKVPMKAKRTFLWNNVEFTLTNEQIKRFAPILREYTTESNEKGSSGISKEITSQVYDLFLEVLENIKEKIKENYEGKGKDGDIIYKILIEDIDKSFEKYVGTRYDWNIHTQYILSKAIWGEKELDNEKLNQNIKKVFTKNVNEDYKEWLLDFISQFQGSSYFLKGNQKIPYTLDNLVDATSNKIVGQEKNMTFGVNQAKSFGTKRLNSIDEIKKNSYKIITKEEMNLIDEKNKENFINLSRSLNYEYSDTWNKLDSLGKALADYFKGVSIFSALRKNDFKLPSPYQITLFEDFANELKNSFVDYFEVKYQEAVSLKEFKYAVVPKNSSKEIIEILNQNGLVVKKYETYEDRLNVVNNLSKRDKSIKFKKGGQVEDLISKGIVELKMFNTKPQHAKEYGLHSVNPLYVQSLCITENQRLKGIGNKVLQYIDDYAIKNGHDLVFGHITQIAEFTKDNRETFFCDTDMIKNWLHSKGYAIQTHNNDFHKVINNDICYAKGGKILAYKTEKDKFNKIGITDKYVIEAINEIGLQGINFDLKSINDKIELEFEDLLKKANTNEYLISKDSSAITNIINNEINQLIKDGATDEIIDNLKLELTNPNQRKKQYIDVYAQTQKESINEWVNYLKQSNYSVAIKFLLLKAVLNFNYDYKTNDLIKRTPTTIRNFSPFDAGSLSELIKLNSDNLLEDYVKIQVDNAIKILRSKELLKTSNGGTWIKFDGGSKTSEEIKTKNAIELSKMVQNTYWCTKTNAKSQLDGGDFYIYATTLNNEVFPRIAIRMEENKVGEVRGNQSASQDLEIEMLPIAKEFLLNNLDTQSGKKWLDSIEYNNSAIELNEKLIKNGLFKNSVEKFLDLKSKEEENLLDYADRNGHIVRIEKQVRNLLLFPSKFYQEKEVVFSIKNFDNKKTKIIFDYADFENSQVTNLGNLETIGGDADFRNSKITDLGNLLTIGGDAFFGNSQVTDLGNLQTIGGRAYFGSNTELKKQWESRGNREYDNGGSVESGNFVRQELNFYKKGGYVSYKDKYNKKYGYKNGESHDLEEISKDTGVSMKGLQQIYNKGIGAYKTNPQSVRPNVKSKEQWAMARVYSSVMGGKASKIDSNELKMEKGGNIKFDDEREVLNKISNINKEKLIILNEVDILISEHKKLFGNIDIEMPKSNAEKESEKKIANLLSRANELVMERRKLISKKTYKQGGNINIKNNNMPKYKDGLFVGKSHKEGGIPMVVKSTGQRIEVEGGESITNKESIADTKVRTLTGTNCEIISQINTQNNNGVALDCDSVVGKKYEYKDGGKIYEKKQNIKIQNMNEEINLKNLKVRKRKIFNPTNSLGFKRNEMPQIRSKFLPYLFEKLDNEGIGYEKLTIDAESLKPSQNEINKDFAKTFNEEKLYEKNVIVSSDNYIIDGHHRWYYCLIEDLPVKITRIDLPIHKALNFIRQLDFIEVDEIAKRGMVINSQRSLFENGGNIETNKYNEQIPISIYEGVIGDFDNDNISNVDDLQPNVPSKIKLEEISLKNEITDIIKYRNLFVDVQKKVLEKIKKINSCGKIQCEIKTRIKTPYSIINKLRRRSLTNVKTLDKLDKKAKEFLKNQNLKGIDLYKGLTDILGFMIVVEDFNFLNKLKAEVETGKLGEVLEFEDFYKNDLDGYRAYHFLLSTEIKGTFIPYELQLRTMRVNKLAKITHTIYKQGIMNRKVNDKISKEIEVADKGNKVIGKIIDKKLENKDLLKNQLTIKKLAFGDIIVSGFLSSYKYKVKNNINKSISSITEYADNEAEARKDLFRKYKNFTLLGISVNNGDFVPINEFKENKKNRSEIDLFDTEQRFEYAREMKKGGVIYRDLSTIKPRFVTDIGTDELLNSNNNEVNEVSITKTGQKYKFQGRKILSSNNSYQLLKDFWNINNLNAVEELNIICLNKQNNPIAIYRHSKGGIDSTTADVEIISALAINTLAKGVIISHNHPSGKLAPSEADIEISKKLKNALKLFDILLLDHLIVNNESYYSMADEGVFKLGGHIDSDCDCSKCRAYESTIIIDEANTKNGKMFLIRLKDLYYIIYDTELVATENNLKDAKKMFELGLFHDNILEKKKFSKGGKITDAEYESLEKIVPKNMLLSIAETKKSWERGESDDVFEHYENLIKGYRQIPNLYEQDEKGFNAIVYLHYFSGGSDWYITELDKKTNEAYGYAILNGDTQNSEFGYMNLNEFVNNNIDLDLYWSFKTLNEIFEKEYPKLVSGEIEYYNKDATLTRLTDFELLIEKDDFKNQYEINKFIELMIDEKGTDVNNYTTTEQTYLLKYTGMGGLQKYGATGSGILWEYYTPKRVVDLMWGLAYKHRGTLGFDRVLENSVGIGNFVNACPLAVKQMDCYDISKYAIAICMVIYGKDERFNFINESFETLFFNGNTSVKENVVPIYDLVIGNPPYSEYSGKYAGMGEKKYTKARNYIDYFIFRSLDLLKSGGILVYVLGSVKGMGQENWLESEDYYTKEKIKEKADLIDAYRLGSGVFDYTDVDSDIIVLRKK